MEQERDHESMESAQAPANGDIPKIRTGRRLLISLLVLASGVVGLAGLSLLKEPPAQAPKKEQALKVEAIRAEKQDVRVFLTGFGEVRSLDVATVAAEVGGRVVEVHASLEEGGVIAGDEVLFRVDPTNYRAAVESARANVDRLETTIARLQKQYPLDRERLDTLMRNAALAQRQHRRLRTLFEQEQVGSESQVEQAEQAVLQARSQAQQMELAVELYPQQIQEAKNSLEASRAQLDTARANLDRTMVRAPFTGRVKKAQVEVGDYAQPGAPAVVMANDGVLEISLPLDARAARQWLLFTEREKKPETAWFAGLREVDCAVRWVEDPDGRKWQGILDRVVDFKQSTRTLVVAVRLPAERALSVDEDSLPLVAGMFCRVEVPGRDLDDVIPVPIRAVTQDDEVYVSREGRLITVPVEIARTQKGYSYVSSGLDAGETVIVTRLVDPLEETLLDVTLLEEPGGER
ncbi:MAG: efflux RND transporter periplasmic adaptor subunit [Desulfatibacillaceae bacterium]